MILILLMLILKLFQKKSLYAVINGGYPEVYEFTNKSKKGFSGFLYKS